MTLPKSVRLDEDLEIKVSKYLAKNRMKFSQLINLALSKFITQNQVVIFEASDADAAKASEEAMDRHKDTIDKLK